MKGVEEGDPHYCYYFIDWDIFRLILIFFFLKKKPGGHGGGKKKGGRLKGGQGLWGRGVLECVLCGN